MIRGATPIFINDFTGGINCNKAFELLDQDQLIVTENYEGSYNVYYKNGCLTKTKGYRKIEQTGVTPIGIRGVAGTRWYFTNPVSGDKQKETILTFENSSGNLLLYRYDGISYIPISFASTISNAKGVCFTSWKNNLYISTGVAPIQKLSVSGTTWSVTALSPSNMAMTNPPYITVHKDRLWITGSGINQVGQIECSGYDDDANWSGTEGDIFNTNYGDGDPITAIKTLKNDLIIYKKDSIWVLSGDNLYNWTQEARQKGIGCIAPHSIQEVDGVHIFLGEDNIYAFDGSNLITLGDNIKDLLKNIDIYNLDRITSTVYDGYYYLSIKDNLSNYNNKEILLSIELLRNNKKAFFLIKDRPISSYINYTGSEDNGEQYALSSSNGYLLKLNEDYKYEETPITTIIHTKFFNFDAPNLLKEIGRVRFNIDRDTERVTATFIKNTWYEYQWDYVIDATSYAGQMAYWDISDWDEANFVGDKAQLSMDIAIPSQLDNYSLAIKLSHNKNKKFSLYNMLIIGTLKELK